MIMISSELKRYKFLIEEFYKRTRNKKFTSDDFRKYKLEDVLKDYPIGQFFYSLVKEGFILKVGETPSKIPSNKGRKINQYIWKMKARRLFL